MANDQLVSTVVTQREETVPHTTVATTPPDTPANVKVIVMQPLKITLIRAGRVYVQTLIGLLGAAGLGADRGMLPTEFGQLVLACAQLALAPAMMSALQNVAELLAKVDVNFPQVRA